MTNLLEGQITRQIDQELTRWGLEAELREDARQEALLGVWELVRSGSAYTPAFLRTVIRRAIRKVVAAEAGFKPTVWRGRKEAVRWVDGGASEEDAAHRAGITVDALRWGRGELQESGIDQEPGALTPRVVRVIEELPPAQRAALDGVLLGESLRETGERVGCSKQSVRRAISRLRSRMAFAKEGS